MADLERLRNDDTARAGLRKNQQRELKAMAALLSATRGASFAMRHLPSLPQRPRQMPLLLRPLPLQRLCQSPLLGRR